MRLASYLIAGLLTSFAMPALAGNVAVADCVVQVNFQYVPTNNLH